MRSEDLQRAERGIVRGLRDEFGPERQHQAGDAHGFSIAIGETHVLVKVFEACPWQLSDTEREARERPTVFCGEVATERAGGIPYCAVHAERMREHLTR